MDPHIAAKPAAPDAATDLFRPSEYTAALVQALRTAPRGFAGARALEIGCGNGTVLAALAGLGAAQLTGIDIETAALQAAQRLLAACGLAQRVELLQGDMYAPVRGRSFDAIVANLPHFPMAPGSIDGRLASWSDGGPDGRRLLDRFLAPLAQHLAPGGRAFLTHNGFVDLDQTRRLAAASGLGARIVHSVLLVVPDAKRRSMTPAVIARESGHSLHPLGPYLFADMHVLELGADLPRP